ncbi:hypothetical protein [Pseudomonas atacamensis]|uniref:hypothetical protein n=1 Tax=Pseudomonas atacamensis TaxID=2565368 RepID=UPI0019D11EDA|nr:hypothetical protein [Pseudomonas atacamensis]QSL86215.1 hypothetical protein JWU58_18830 [Pseudomonas atacamensis]
MTNLANFTRSIPSFDSKSYISKIEFFGWYLHEINGKEKFGASDIIQCFEEAHCQRPTNIHNLLRQLCEKKPAHLLKDTQGYRLASSVRIKLASNVVKPVGAQTRSLLSGLILQVSDVSKKLFLDETIACFNNGAYRAAIIMAWNLAYSHVCDQIFNGHLASFNAQRSKVFPKLPELKKRTDFEDYKESNVIEICRGGRILDSTVCKVLTGRLDRRNSAAHPSSAIFLSIQAEDQITDLINNVLLNKNV